MTRGLSWAGMMVVKSSSKKVLHGILGRPLVVIEWTDWMARRCLFRVVLKRLPLANPPSIVLTCRVLYLGSWFSREGLLRIFPSLRPMFLSGIGLAMVLITSRTPCFDRSFLRGLSLRGRVLHTISLFLFFLVGRWSLSKRRDPSHPNRVYFSFRSLEWYLSLCEDLYELVFVWTKLRKWSN